MDIENIKAAMKEMIGRAGSDFNDGEYAFFVGEKIWDIIKLKWEELYIYDADIKMIAYKGYKIYKVRGFYDDRIFFGKAHSI